MSALITKLAPITEDMIWGATPYALEIKGEAERRVTITELLNTETGDKTVRIVALATAGVPAQSLAMLDHIARRILPNAKVKPGYKKADNRIVREYAVA